MVKLKEIVSSLFPEILEQEEMRNEHLPEFAQEKSAGPL